MHMGQMHYLPLTPEYFAILVGFFLLVVLLLATLRYAYLSLGVSSGTALLLLLGSLVGSYFNIPLFQLPPERVLSNQVEQYFGVYYVVPYVTDWGGTEIAVNVGGALIPTLMSIYLLFKHAPWGRGIIATAIVAVLLHWLANPVLASVSPSRSSGRRSSRRSSPWSWRGITRRRSPTSPAAWAH